MPTKPILLDSTGQSILTAAQGITAALEDVAGLQLASKMAKVAPDFSASTAYAAGDYVFYGGTLYRFTADHAAGAWIGTDATAVVLTDDVGELKSAVTDCQNDAIDKLYEKKEISGIGFEIGSLNLSGYPETNPKRARMTGRANVTDYSIIRFVCDPTVECRVALYTLQSGYGFERWANEYSSDTGYIYLRDCVAARAAFRIKDSTSDITTEQLATIATSKLYGYSVEVVKDLENLESLVDFDEYLINNGEYTIQASDIVQGMWSYSTPSKTTNPSHYKRARTKTLLPVRAGMIIYYSNTTFDTYFGVLETPTSSSYIQTIGWKTDDDGMINITKDGYLTFVIRNHDDNTSNVAPTEYDSVVTIKTKIKKDLSVNNDSLKSFNACNAAFETSKFKSQTINGITFAWDEDNICTINGTATSTTVNIISSSGPIPRIYERGHFYPVKFNTTDDSVSLRILLKNSEDTIISTEFVHEDTFIFIPVSAENWSIGLYISDTSHTFEDAVVSNIGVLTTESNNELLTDNSNRYYSFSDMQHGYYYTFTLDALHFRDTERLKADSLMSCILIPVRSGETVFLSTYGGASNAKAYGIIPHDRIISYIGPNHRVRTKITIDSDGWIAVNCVNSNSEEFFCQVEASPNRVGTSALFANSLTNDAYAQIPPYDDDNPCRVLRHDSTLAGMIQHWGIIGASFDCGEVNYTVEGELSYREMELYDYSPWSHWKRMNGIMDMYHYTDGGQNAKDWISLTATATRGWAYSGYSAPDTPSTVANPEINGAWSGRSAVGVGGGCWWKMKQDHENGNTKQAFIIHLGGNDLSNNNPHNENWEEYQDGQYDETKYYKCGTIEDIGTYDLDTDTDTPPAGKQDGVITGVVNSFAAYVGAVLNRILAIQPDAKIFYLTIRNLYSQNQNSYNLWLQYNNVLRQIAEMPQYKDNVYIVDEAKFGANWRCHPIPRMWTGAHLDVMGYKYMASYFNTMIDYVIQTHMSEFKQTMFIGSGKHCSTLS